MNDINRRDAAKGLAASLAALTTVGQASAAEEPKLLEEVRPNPSPWLKSSLATLKAFHFLEKVGHFTREECVKARKAIMKKQTEEEEKWRCKFMNATGLMLIWTPHLIRMPMCWQAIRLSFLLSDDGFELLQIKPWEQDAIISLGEHVRKIREKGNKITITLPNIDIPDKVFGG